MTDAEKKQLEKEFAEKVASKPKIKVELKRSVPTPFPEPTTYEAK